MIKYNDLVANAMIFQNVVDQRRILAKLIAEGFPVQREDVATLSPYPTAHLKRFGEYVVDLDTPPQPLNGMKLVARSSFDFATLRSGRAEKGRSC